MSETTTIEWTDATWSPWEGCTKVSPGCDHCYAEGMNRWLRKGENWGPGAPRRIYSSDHWDKPVRWNDKAKAEGRRMRVFPSVCDPFDNEVAPVILARFLDLIRRTPDIDWLLLTKRIGNVERLLRQARDAIDFDRDRALWLWITEWYREGNPPRNVWLGATVVNQEEADRDIPKLLDIPARVRFLSCEPLLGPIELRHALGFLGVGGVDWVIVGGESGRGARPMHPDWARSLRDQCAAAGVPFLFKQWGAWAPGAVFADTIPSGEYCDFDGTLKTDDERVWHVPKKAAGRLLDGIEHNGFPPSASKSSEP